MEKSNKELSNFKILIRENLLMLIIICLFLLSYQPSVAEIKSKIIFKDGSKITGIILQSEFEDSVLVELGGGFKVSYPKNNIADIISQRNILTVGVGFGIPYGMFGVNTEIEPIPHINFTFGVGTTLLAGVAWDVGIIGYLFDQDKVIRPRISLIYGTNAILELETYSDIEYESYPGLSTGAGIKLQMGENHGMTADLYYLLVNGAEDKQKELEKKGYYFKDIGIPIKLSVGYQFSF